jgi:hypothetical protein
VGAYFQFLNMLGETKLTLELRKSYWEFTQSVLDDATRDRAAITHVVKPATDLTIIATPNVNRYNVDGHSNVMSTAGFDFDIVYRLLDAQPYLAVGYGFDGEYNLSREKDFDATGAYTELFPLRTREIHFVSLAGGWEFSEDTYAEGLVGYGIDRFGGNGPSIEAKLTHEFTKSLDGQIRGYYGLDSANSNNNLSRVGSYVRWRF